MITSSFISKAAKQHQRKKRGRGSSELLAPPPEPEGHLGNVAPGGGTDTTEARSAAGTTLTRTRRPRAAAHGSPCDEHTHSAVSPSHSTTRRAAPEQHTASVAPPAPPPPAEEYVELISDTEVDPGPLQMKFQPCVTWQISSALVSFCSAGGRRGAARRRVSVLPK